MVLAALQLVSNPKNIKTKRVYKHTETTEIGKLLPSTHLLSTKSKSKYNSIFYRIYTGKYKYRTYRNSDWTSEVENDIVEINGAGHQIHFKTTTALRGGVRAGDDVQVAVLGTKRP